MSVQRKTREVVAAKHRTIPKGVYDSPLRFNQETKKEGHFVSSEKELALDVEHHHSQLATVKKQYRLTVQQAATLRRAQGMFRFHTETEAVRMSIELLEKLMTFAEQGWDLAVIDHNRNVRALHMVGLRLIVHDHPVFVNVEEAKPHPPEKALPHHQIEKLEHLHSPHHQKAVSHTNGRSLPLRISAVRKGNSRKSVNGKRHTRQRNEDSHL